MRNKELEEKDAEWARTKLDLLKEERKALKDEDIKTAKRINLNFKLHEKKRLVPAKQKRKADSKTGESPDLKKQTKKPTPIVAKPSLSSSQKLDK